MWSDVCLTGVPVVNDVVQQFGLAKVVSDLLPQACKHLFLGCRAQLLQLPSLQEPACRVWGLTPSGGKLASNNAGQGVPPMPGCNKAESAYWHKLVSTSTPAVQQTGSKVLQRTWLCTSRETLWVPLVPM